VFDVTYPVAVLDHGSWCAWAMERSRHLGLKKKRKVGFPKEPHLKINDVRPLPRRQHRDVLRDVVGCAHEGPETMALVAFDLETDSRTVLEFRNRPERQIHP
jgi:hypothetical protein